MNVKYFKMYSSKAIEVNAEQIRSGANLAKQGDLRTGRTAFLPLLDYIQFEKSCGIGRQ